MRIFLTGATGVIGLRLVPLLVAAHHRVTALGRTAPKRTVLERLGAEPAAVDLFDAWAVRRAVAHHDTVINLATHIPRSSLRMMLPGAWRENDRIRRTGSRILAEAAQAEGVTRFIQESFAPIYEDGGEGWVDELAPVRFTRYNRSVGDAEHSAGWFTERGGTGIVLRFAAFYGPDAAQTLELIASVRKGRALLPGRPEGFFSSISHDDAAAAALAALGVPAGIYNAGDDEPVTRREYVDTLAQALGVPPPRFPPSWLTRLGGSLAETIGRSLRLSNRKLREATGWTPQYRSVRQGWRPVVAALGANAGLIPQDGLGEAQR
jgi:nucleoside-diphosphate-sugar epimerase